MSAVSIRTLSLEDSLTHLTDLLHRAYERLGTMGLNYTAVDQTSEVTAKRVAGGVCFVAEVSESIVGTIVITPTYTKNECAYFTRPGVASVHQFAVDPTFQRQGIGAALLAHCEAWASENGFCELAIDTAEPANHLIRFSHGLGYQPASSVQWPGKVYRSIVLSKRLT